MWSKKFWQDAAERAVKTVAQTAAGLLGAGAVGLLDVDWLQLASVAGLAGLASVLTSIGSTGFGREDSASVIG